MAEDSARGSPWRGSSPAPRGALLPLRGQILGLLLSQNTSWTFRGSVNWAQALGRHFSTQMSLELAYTDLTATRWDVTETEPVEREVSSWALGVGIALTADLNPALPFAIQAEYRLDTPLTTKIDGVDAPSPIPGRYVGGGIYYSGRRDVVLGASVGGLLDASTTLTTKLLLAEFRMQYFF